ncbi:hypothetical protein Hanom_Chr16g01463531 [Helianthus anomalus]
MVKNKPCPTETILHKRLNWPTLRIIIIEFLVVPPFHEPTAFVTIDFSRV